MASTKLAFLAIAVLLLQASWRVVAQQGSNASVMVVTSFEASNGHGPAACDGSYHSDDGLFVALSTPWYEGGNRCHKHIRITISQNTTAWVVAEVLDECDTQSGCRPDMVGASKAVWAGLGLNTDIGESTIAWAEAP